MKSQLIRGESFLFQSELINWAKTESQIEKKNTNPPPPPQKNKTNQTTTSVIESWTFFFFFLHVFFLICVFNTSDKNT